MSSVAPTATTLSAAMTRLQKTVSLTAGTNVAVGSNIVIGGEICTVQVLVKSDGTIVEVERGQNGTAAKPHASGTSVYVSSTASPPTYTFGTKNGRPVLKNDITGILPDMYLPLGSRVVDPDTGFEYLTVDCQEAMTVGEWVVIDENGLATPLNAASKGRVGIITQAIGASDNYALALVVGKYAGAQVSSLSSLAPPNWIAAYGTVSGVAFVVPGGTSAIATVSGTAPGVNLIFGAIYVAETTSGVSSGTSLPGITVFLENPYVQGLGLFTT
jgi:hypothetical protein